MVTSTKSVSGIISGGVLVLVVLFVAWRAHVELSLPGIWLTVLVGLSGIALGWLVGFLASPYGPEEDTRFAKYVSLISLFLSGYALAKIDGVVEAVLEGTLTEAIYGIRLAVFFTCLVVSAITMYVFRLYTGRPDPGVAQTASRPPNQAPAPGGSAAGEGNNVSRA